MKELTAQVGISEFYNSYRKDWYENAQVCGMECAPLPPRILALAVLSVSCEALTHLAAAALRVGPYRQAGLVAVHAPLRVPAA